MYLYFNILPIEDLQFGVHRPKSWWLKHPKAQKMLQKLITSIQKEGLRNPLTVIKQQNKYIVEVGNQRLQALIDLGIEKVIINSSSSDLELLNKCVEIFGSQSIVVSVDVRKNFFGKY